MPGKPYRVLRFTSENTDFSQVVVGWGNAAVLTLSPSWRSCPGHSSESQNWHTDHTLSFPSFLVKLLSLRGFHNKPMVAAELIGSPNHLTVTGFGDSMRGGEGGFCQEIYK